MKYYPTLFTILFLLVQFSGKLSAQDCSINLLVVYTAEAADSLLGNEQAVEDIIAAAKNLNTSLIYSEVEHSINLVRTIRLSEFESGCFVTDLNSFQENPLIEHLRDEYHADMAALILTDDEFCGLPYLDNEVANENTAYCAVNFSCLINTYGLSHQLAHLYGCNHYIEEGDDVDDAPYTNGHAYQWAYEESASFSTILGVDDDYFCEMNSSNEDDLCNLIPYFSNPLLSYYNVPLGVSGVQNNSAILNQNAPLIGSFKVVPDKQRALNDTVGFYDIAKASALDTLSTGASYRIQDQAKVVFTAEDRITLNPGFVAEEGVRFETVLKSPQEECKQ